MSLKSLTWIILHKMLQPKNELRNEIKCINQQFVETMIDLDLTEDLASTETGEGTVIRCSYSAVALSQNLKLLYASSHMVSFVNSLRTYYLNSLLECLFSLPFLITAASAFFMVACSC